MHIDPIDRQILQALSLDARASMATLAGLTHLSRAAVHSRFTRLKASGVISSFTVRLNPELAGVQASAFVLLTVVQREWRTVRNRLSELPEIEHCALISGSSDMLALVRASSARTLRGSVIERMQQIPGVQNTRTLMIFEEWFYTPQHPPESNTR